MAEIEKAWKCDICSKKFPTLESLRNEVAIRNGEDSGVYVDVCDKCVKGVAERVNELKPKQ